MILVKLLRQVLKRFLVFLITLFFNPKFLLVYLGISVYFYGLFFYGLTLLYFLKDYKNKSYFLKLIALVYATTCSTEVPSKQFLFSILIVCSYILFHREFLTSILYNAYIRMSSTFLTFL